jgi:hypothetical protein
MDSPSPQNGKEDRQKGTLWEKGTHCEPTVHIEKGRGQCISEVFKTIRMGL